MADLRDIISTISNGDTEREAGAVFYRRSGGEWRDAFFLHGERDRLALPCAQLAQRGLAIGADHLLLVHTHPSGDPRPSAADIAVTRQLCGLLRWQGMRLADHIILTHTDYFSFRLHGML